MRRELGLVLVDADADIRAGLERVHPRFEGGVAQRDDDRKRLVVRPAFWPAGRKRWGIRPFLLNGADPPTPPPVPPWRSRRAYARCGAAYAWSDGTGLSVR